MFALIFSDFCKCQTDEEFKTQILQRLADQDAKILLQDEKILEQDKEIKDLKKTDAILKSQLEMSIFRSQESLVKAGTQLEKHMKNVTEMQENHEEILNSVENNLNERIDNLTFDLEVTSLMSAPSSCFELWQNGITSAKKIHIDFDGRRKGKKPILVKCDFSTKSTVVGEEKTIEFEECDGNACDEKKIIEDEATLSQTIALINSSNICNQTIKFECVSAPIRVSF